MASTDERNRALIEIKEAFGLVPEWISRLPDSAVGGFWSQMRDFYLAETLIPNKYKELIGIAVSGATRCKYCVLFHTEGAKLHGASDAEIAEACMMAGVTMNASTFLNAAQIDYEQFEKETRKIVAHVREKMTKAPAARPAPAARA